MTRIALCTAAALCLTSLTAHADGETPSRVFGIGWGAAAGHETTSVGTDHIIVEAVNLEARFALSSRLELAATVPVLNLLYGNGAFGNTSDHQHIVWFDAFALWYPLRESSGLFVGPGLGLVWGRTDMSSGVGIEIPARIGWENTRPSRGFGKAVAVRPWFDYVLPSGNVDNGTRYGVLFELTLTGYSTK